MFGILVITHGAFSHELLKSLELIMGEQEDIATLGLCHGDSVEALKESAEAVVNKNKENGKNTLILVDIMGGSPSNVAMSLLRDHDVKIISGVNMPMLIAAIEARMGEDADFFNSVYETAKNEILQKDRAILFGK